MPSLPSPSPQAAIGAIGQEWLYQAREVKRWSKRQVTIGIRVKLSEDLG